MQTYMELEIYMVENPSEKMTLSQKIQAVRIR